MSSPAAARNAPRLPARSQSLPNRRETVNKAGPVLNAGARYCATLHRLANPDGHAASTGSETGMALD